MKYEPMDRGRDEYSGGFKNIGHWKIWNLISILIVVYTVVYIATH